jgi:hypothetical protein
MALNMDHNSPLAGLPVQQHVGVIDVHNSPEKLTDVVHCHVAAAVSRKGGIFEWKVLCNDSANRIINKSGGVAYNCPDSLGQSGLVLLVTG